MLMLALYPAAATAQGPPDDCSSDSIQPLSVSRPWRGVFEFSEAGSVSRFRSTTSVRCLELVLNAGEFVRAVAKMETEPPWSTVSILLYVPGEATPVLSIEFGDVDRAAVTWRAEESGSHYLVIRDVETMLREVTEVPVRIWVEQVEAPALVEARYAALSVDPRVGWLRENVMPIRSIDPDDEDFSDLEPLRIALDGVRIVMLGEVDHFSGSDFLAKSRLVKFLHQELGFDVLAFEAGLYGMTVAWDSLRSGAAPRQAMASGAWGFWANSEQTQSLIDYVAEQARGMRPIELTGFDNQFMPQGASTHFARDLASFLVDRGLSGPLVQPASPSRIVLESLATMRYRRDEKPLPDSTIRSAFLSDLDETIAAAAALNDDTARYWTQMLRGTACHTRRVFAEMAGDPNLGPDCLREWQMAEHLIWLANERYSGRRIIVWSATLHAARMPETPPAYGSGPSMGQRIGDVFGSKSYAIGVTSYRSAAGLFVPDQHPLPEFEELMATAGYDYGLLDLRRARTEGNWAGGEFLARAIDMNATTSAVWSELLDALLFIREYQPRTPVR